MVGKNIKYKSIKEFWNCISKEKYNTSHMSHWLGTGIIKFK